MKLLRGDVPHVNTMAILTAQNPMGQRVSAAQNYQRNKALMRDLRTGNFNPINIGNSSIKQLNTVKLKGKFLGNMEDSFIIPHVTRDIAIYLARKHDQLAVIWGEKKSNPEIGDYIRFEWIEATNPNDTTQPYITTQTRDIILANDEVNARDDNFSATGGKSPKMLIPFFDPRYQNAKYTSDKRSIELNPARPDYEYRTAEDFHIPFFDDLLEGLMPEIEMSGDVTFEKKELPDTPEVQQAIESIAKKAEYLSQDNLSSKAYWSALGSLNEQVKQLSHQLRS